MDKATMAGHKLSGTCLICGEIRTDILIDDDEPDEDIKHDTKWLCEEHWVSGSLDGGFNYRCYGWN